MQRVSLIGGGIAVLVAISVVVHYWLGEPRLDPTPEPAGQDLSRNAAAGEPATRPPQELSGSIAERVEVGAEILPYPQDFRRRYAEVQVAGNTTVHDRTVLRNRLRDFEGDTAMWMASGIDPITKKPLQRALERDEQLYGTWHFAAVGEGDSLVRFDWFKVFREDGTLVEGRGDPRLLSADADVLSEMSDGGALRVEGLDADVHLWRAQHGLLRYFPATGPDLDLDSRADEPESACQYSYRVTGDRLQLLDRTGEPETWLRRRGE